MRTLLIFVLATAACSDTAIVVGGLQEVASMRASMNRDLDILFVVDSSPSMADKQLSLAQNFPRMIDVLAQLDGGLPNLHLGVVTSDMGTNGGPAIGQVGNGGLAGVRDDGALVPAETPELAGPDIRGNANGRGRAPPAFNPR